LKLESYQMREAFAQADWDTAIRILCGAVGLSEDAVFALAIQPLIDDSRGPSESISIYIGSTYAYWDAAEGFGLLTFQNGLLQPTIRIYRREAN